MREFEAIIVDNTQRGPANKWLSFWWRMGAELYFALGWVDTIILADSWPDAYRQIEFVCAALSERRAPPAKLKLARYWGHGSAGKPQIDGHGPNLPRLRDAWGQSLKDPVNDGEDGWSEHWFQMCDVLQGQRGQRWAVTAAEHIGAIVGHTRVVSQAWPPRSQYKLLRGVSEAFAIVFGALFQSGGYALRPAETPHWTASDRGYSFIGQKHTVTLMARRPPRKWFQ